MNEKMMQLKNARKYLEIHQTIARNYGANPTEASIISVVRGGGEPIALDELAAITGYSLATISNIVRKFENHGILIRTRKPRSKKIYVESNKNYLETMKKKLQLIQINTKLLVDGLPEIIKETTDKKRKSHLKSELTQAEEANKIINKALKDLDKVMSSINSTK